MNCVLYARVSTDKQAQKDLFIPAQMLSLGYRLTKMIWEPILRVKEVQYDWHGFF